VKRRVEEDEEEEHLVYTIQLSARGLD